jgi:hypothetical protein
LVVLTAAVHEHAFAERSEVRPMKIEPGQRLVVKW